MSQEGEETIIVATLPPDVETRDHARSLLRKHRNGNLGKSIGFDYKFYGATPDWAGVLDVLELPWRSGSSSDFHTLLIRARDVGRAVAACESLVADRDALADAILAAVDGEPDELAELREFVDDETSLLEPMDADTLARRLAQVFAAVVRTLRRAQKRGRGILVVHQIRADD